MTNYCRLKKPWVVISSSSRQSLEMKNQLSKLTTKMTKTTTKNMKFRIQKCSCWTSTLEKHLVWKNQPKYRLLLQKRTQFKWIKITTKSSLVRNASLWRKSNGSFKKKHKNWFTVKTESKSQRQRPPNWELKWLKSCSISTSWRKSNNPNPSSKLTLQLLATSNKDTSMRTT